MVQSSQVTNREREIEILLVEDNPADVRLTIKAFQMGKLRNKLYSVEDGEQALAFLRREGPYSDAQRPDLILLDLNMPNMDGREVLAEIKNDPDLLTIPVIVLTTSEAEQDILESYRLHANCYISKPVTMERFIQVIGSAVEDFWINIVKLPPKE
jgi:chemotaxis family two-component system response regulator Rcp1